MGAAFLGAEAHRPGVARRARGTQRGWRAVVPRLPPRARQHDAVDQRNPEEGDATAGDHKRAAEAWRDLAGEISAEWALTHREEIIAAALLQRGASPLNGTQETYEPVEGGLAANLAHALVTHLSDVRNLGPEGESLPLLLDDPFLALDASVKPALLELLSRSAGSPQVIFLTNDPDVLTWARLEALTGEIGILEAAPSMEEDPDSVDLSTQA